MENGWNAWNLSIYYFNLSLALSVLMAIFQVNLGYLVFNEATNDGGGGDDWSYKSCKAPVKSSPPTNQHTVSFTGRMPFLSPNQQCQSTEGEKTSHSISITLTCCCITRLGNYKRPAIVAVKLVEELLRPFY